MGTLQIEVETHVVDVKSPLRSKPLDERNRLVTTVDFRFARQPPVTDRSLGALFHMRFLPRKHVFPGAPQ